MYYRNLDVWKKSIEVVKKIYMQTENFPEGERFGLVAQIRRAAVSIPSNIAEGVARYSDRDSSRFMDIAIGSVAELETQLIISNELGFIDKIDEIMEELKQINSMAIGLKKFYTK